MLQQPEEHAASARLSTELSTQHEVVHTDHMAQIGVTALYAAYRTDAAILLYLPAMSGTGWSGASPW